MESAGRTLSRTLNLALRTLRALVPAWSRPEDALAERWLPPELRALYGRMDPRDRHHAERVARRVLERAPDAPPRLVRAALLHDVGKARRPFVLWQRIAAHLWTPADLPAEPLAPGLRGAWQVARHHERYGAEMIRRAGGEGADEVAALVARLAAPGDDPEARLLRRLDDEAG